SDAPVIRMINALLLQALRERASDIHFEPYDARSVVRFRVDGVLRDIIEPPRALHAALVSRIKVMASLDMAEKRLPQDGRMALNIMTVEDPIEFALDGVGQTQVNPRIELTFARSLRSILRQDPDIIMIGEIRDLETAQIAVQASLTGHLVLATLHTNDAVSAVTRLADMGVEPYLLASSLLGVLAQRLVRCLCTECREAVAPTGGEAAVLERLGVP